MNHIVQNILNRFSTRQLLAIVTGLILFVLMGLSAQLSSTSVAPLSGVVIEETLAENQVPTPYRPSEEQHGWTAWSG